MHGKCMGFRLAVNWLRLRKMHGNGLTFRVVVNWVCVRQLRGNEVASQLTLGMAPANAW